MSERGTARITKYALTSLMLYSLLCTEGIAADFSPENAVPISLPLYLDKRPLGTVQMLMMPDPQASYVQVGPLLAMLKNLVPADRLKALLAAATRGFLNLKDGAKGGVELHFDERLAALVVTIPSESKMRRSLTLRGSSTASNKTITAPSPVSAYLNVFGAQDFVDSGLPAQDMGRQPFRTSVDGALNMSGWVLESSGNYLEGDPHSWQRNDTRLVHDLPDSMMRTAMGDLSYPIEGFQSFQPMLGLTLARDFDLQPYRVSEPTGQTSFFLNSPSRVDIYVNDRKVQTLQLNSGPYNISEFPVVNGSNNVKLVITDATGRVEIKDVDIVSDSNLLAAGLGQFAYNVGFVSSTADRQQHYDFGQPVLSVFHRYGFTDSLTLGANMQADVSQQMAGFDTTMGTAWGVLRTDLGGSHLGSGKNGVAWQIQYQIVDRGDVGADLSFDGTKNFTMLADYRSRNFAPLGLLLPDNTSSYQVTARYSQQLSPTVNAGVGTSYEVGRSGQRDDSDYTLSLDKQFSAGIHVNVTLERRTVGGYGVFANLSWTPWNSRHSVNSSYDSFSKTARVDWDYAQENQSDSLSASAGAVRTEDRYDASGSITYYGERGQASASHDVVTPYGSGNGQLSAIESVTELRFASAIVYSGGHVALSRPVRDSFAIFAPDPSIEDYPIGINPQLRPGGERGYEAATDGWGPAVLPDLTPYLYRTVRVDASKLPPGYDAGDSTYTFFPTYRSGTFVRLGSDANVLLDGTLQYMDRTPVALQAGTVSLAGKGEAVPEAFFTNRAGRFRIEKLKPGRYVLELYSFPGIVLPLIVPEGAAGPTEAGILTLPVTSDGNKRVISASPSKRGTPPVPAASPVPALGPVPRHESVPLSAPDPSEREESGP